MSETPKQSNLDLQGQLAEAKNIFRECNARLKATPEFKEVAKTMNRISRIQAQIKAEEKRESDLAKEEILAAGFELRNNHTTYSTSQHDWQSHKGELWTFVIVHKLRPQFSHIAEFSSSIKIYIEDPICVDENNPEPGDLGKQQWLLGYGKTEAEAWQTAVDAWCSPISSEVVKAAALEGIQNE
ncbi:MAG TPA: hypothetical protein VIQ31_05130 [Phormidium sp.]